MHYHFDLSATQILWTITFAGLLVLLVVLMGRDRVRRFPCFTASILMMTLLLLTEQLLFGRISRLSATRIYLTLSDIDVVVGLLLVVELARRSFRGAGRLAWTIGALVVVAVGVTATILWGPWPAWKALTANSELTKLRLMELVLQKGSLLIGALAIELGILVALLGRRFQAGWRSHAQQIAIGFSTASLAQLAFTRIMQAIGAHTQVHTQADVDRVTALRDKLIHANDAIYVCVLLWWIAWLWMDEPGAASEAAMAEEAALDAESEELPATESEALPPEAPTADAVRPCRNPRPRTPKQAKRSSRRTRSRRKIPGSRACFLFFAPCCRFAAAQMWQLACPRFSR